jgi:hypothetical protein
MAPNLTASRLTMGVARKVVAAADKKTMR